MKKPNVVIGALVAAAVIAGGAVLALSMGDSETVSTTPTTNTQQTTDKGTSLEQQGSSDSQQAADKSTSSNATQPGAQSGSEQTTEQPISYKGETGKTALQILKEKYTVLTNESSLGEFVTSINGEAADENTQYWAFYVNGQYASEGAGTYQTKESDVIEWKLEAIQ